MATIVLYPAPFMGHFISMVELGKFILKHHHHSVASITVLTLTDSFSTGSAASYVRRISASFPAITFHHLPHIPLLLDATSEAMMFDLIERNIQNVENALRSIAPAALIIDLFCTSAMAAAASLHVPVYYFITFGACCLVELLYFPTLDRDYPGSFKEMNRLVYSPGMPPIPSADMPTVALDRDSTNYSDFLEVSKYIPRSNGIIVNTFEALEPKPIKAITDGVCVEGHPTPPLYCIGPVLADGCDSDGDCPDNNECLNWLDLQRSRSVVYLSFGSEGLFSSDQLKEIANGLEMSGHRFLWVIRSSPTLPRIVEDELGGFVERTKGRGLVVREWAPQVKVLSHESVGGFVTHCGWNSMLEATRAGVPMVAWPLYAEQRLNKIVMVEEMKVALPMDEWERGKVMASEVEKRVRQLMEESDEEGKIVRKTVNERTKDAKSAIDDKNGSSRVALTKLVNSWMK